MSQDTFAVPTTKFDVAFNILTAKSFAQTGEKSIHRVICAHHDVIDIVNEPGRLTYQQG